jgi:type IV secretory pathway VirB10-like protein
MVNTRIGIAVLATSSLVAAGAGGFLATRYNSTPAAQTAVASPAESGPEPVKPPDAAQPVQETEAVMDEGGAAPATTSSPTRTPAAKAAPPAAKAARETTATPPARKAEQRKAGATPDRPATANEHPASPAPRASAASRPSSSTAAEGTSSARGQTTSVPVRPGTDTPIASDSRSDARGAESSEARSYEAARRVEPVEQPKWQEPQVDELIVSADSVIGLQLKNTVSSETSQVEDRVEAQVVRDVAVGGRVAIPAGSRVLGAVTVVERGGKVRDRARLGVRFHTLVLGDGTTLQLQTDTVYRDGDSPSGSSAAKMGGAAIGGAIVGAILGGGKGAVIGGATGAAGGTAAVMAGSRRPATMASGSTVTVRVLSPVAVNVER